MTKTKPDYRAQYLDPRWQKRRLEILQICDWKCVECESTDKTLHVHHKYYAPGRKVWDYPDVAFVALCDKCHEEGHEFFEEMASSDLTFREDFETIAKVFIHSPSDDPRLFSLTTTLFFRAHPELDQKLLLMALELSYRLDCGIPSALLAIGSIPAEDEGREKFCHFIQHEDFWILVNKLRRVA